MTQSQTIVAAAVEAAGGVDGFFINVAGGNLDVGGMFDETRLSHWRKAMSVCAQEGDIDITCLDEDDRAIPLGQLTDAVGQRLRFLIKLPVHDGAVHLLAIEQLRTLLKTPTSLAGVSVVRIAGLEGPFASEAISFETWADGPTSAPIRSPRIEGSPRRFVKCLAPNFMAPSEIEPWLEKDGAPSSSQFRNEWKEAASIALCRSLTNEIFMDGDTPQCVLASTPSRRLAYGQERNVSDDEFVALQACARWVFLEGADIEVRHTLFTNELGREWRDDRPYLDGVWARLLPSLDAAKLAYRAHLKTGSKETLKSLSDLRKTLGDEIQKLMQQTRDLSANVWRDIAIALGVTAIRFGLDPTKIAGAKAGFSVVFALTAIYIWASYWVALKTNRDFLQVIEDTRTAWRDKLYGYLDKADYAALAEKPIRDATAAYDRTKNRTTLAVSVIVLALFGVAIWESELASAWWPNSKATRAGTLDTQSPQEAPKGAKGAPDAGAKSPAISPKVE
ncbi:hypothetical protein [Methylocystis heyeri]|uniref:Uncharacterized protein n=1 Tax=Methylocystis heyeri TaxID=391905 RepID=A0A6B8KIP6_9HYPH|nr:hypothetical protein [Methylocystis heyeri]QGM48244.1 hypothetical protein H2LOC_020875 [Methylocystis heyeri]